MHQHHASEDPRIAELGVAIALMMAFSLPLMYCDSAQAVQFYSAKNYSFWTEAPPHGQAYTYLWSASDGHSNDYRDRLLNWTAPDVDAPVNATIEVNVSNGVCWGTNELQLTVYPQPRGDFRLEKSFDGNGEVVNFGATMGYTINITNTGETNITHLPLTDFYPRAFLKPIGSNRPWKEDNGSALIWDNLLQGPLSPGHFEEVSVSFRAIGITDQRVTNLARAEGALDDMGTTLETEQAESTIEGIRYQCTKLGPDRACAGEEVPFSALPGLASYQWMAKDEQGNMVAGFSDSTGANATWRPPGPGVFEISFNNVCRQMITVRQCNSSIRIDKDCVHKDPVHIGDAVTYVYNVTNTGELPLYDVNVTDSSAWGQDCLPVYMAGDDGDGVLDPAESWRYECRYIVPDPSNYTRLHIMAAGDDSARTAALVRRLTEMQARLQIKMDNLRSMVQQFDSRAASLEMASKPLGGMDYTLYNYTNTVTGESFSKMVDPQGKLNRTIYSDPLSETVLTTAYDASGKILSHELEDLLNSEHLRIQYDVPSQGLRTSTMTDHKTGDTLILVADGQGKILSREYRKTPGFEPREERIYLRNTATVTARSPDGRNVSDLDSFTLEIFRPLPTLGLTKTDSPDPVMPGGTLNYTISFQNAGSEDAHAVVIEEAYVQELEFLWADPAPDPGTIDKWTVGDLKRGESGEIRIRAKVGPSTAPGQQIINRADLTCRENITAQAMINTTVGGSALKITKAATPDIIGPGERLAYTIKYWNDGTEKQSGVVIHDYLDENVVFEMAWPMPTDKSGRHYWWEVGDLEAGQSGEIDIQTAVSENLNAKFIYNNYKITSLLTKADNATLETPIVQSLWINKTTDKMTYNRDENITYIISFGNAGRE